MAHIKFISLISAGLLTLGLAAAPPAQAQSVHLSSGSSSSSLPISSSEEIDYPGFPEIFPDITERLEVPVPGFGNRDVLVSLPENYDPTRSYPVWLAYPGRFISPEHMSTDTGLQIASDAIVAYARGEGGAFAGAPYAVTEIAEDIAYSRAIIDRIELDYAIDRSRVYAIGHSNGGGFSLALACYAPDLVAGVASVSGIYYNPGTPVSGECLNQAVPTMIIHSRDDGLSLIDGATAHGAPYVGARPMARTWAQINGCEGNPLPRPVTPGVTAHVSQGCERETEFVLAESRDHGWPSYSAFVAWEFLSRQSR
ncbi:alpha/beta hydrolase family esterase [Corynebacterium sp. A21]|uniref:alpha/beta hydrolase family esterase n=1 Tax=Corynebacterium sp. A21 TaxID=3457318 RepID=UPI003FD4EB68